MQPAQHPPWVSLPHDPHIEKILSVQTWSSVLPEILLLLCPGEVPGFWDKTRGENRRNLKVCLLPFDLALQRKSMQKASQILSGNVNISALQGHLPGQQSLQPELRLMSASHEKVWGHRSQAQCWGQRASSAVVLTCPVGTVTLVPSTGGSLPQEINSRERNADVFFSIEGVYFIERPKMSFFM